MNDPYSPSAKGDHKKADQLSRKPAPRSCIAPFSRTSLVVVGGFEGAEGQQGVVGRPSSTMSVSRAGQPAFLVGVVVVHGRLLLRCSLTVVWCIHNGIQGCLREVAAARLSLCARN